jgi:putative ABC transport system ATP-binding protein
MVTHDARAAAHSDRVVFLADGTAVAELVAPSADLILDQMKILGA